MYFYYLGYSFGAYKLINIIPTRLNEVANQCLEKIKLELTKTQSGLFSQYPRNFPHKKF